MGGIDLKKARREDVRWYLLDALNRGRPIGAPETMLHTTLCGIAPDITQMEIRRELDYLVARDLVEIEGRDTPVWFAKLNRRGIDITEYTVDCHPGIARPPKYWEE